MDEKGKKCDRLKISIYTYKHELHAHTRETGSLCLLLLLLLLTGHFRGFGPQKNRYRGLCSGTGFFFFDQETKNSKKKKYRRLRSETGP